MRLAFPPWLTGSLATRDLTASGRPKRRAAGAAGALGIAEHYAAAEQDLVLLPGAEEQVRVAL